MLMSSKVGTVAARACGSKACRLAASVARRPTQPWAWASATKSMAG